MTYPYKLSGNKTISSVFMLYEVAGSIFIAFGAYIAKALPSTCFVFLTLPCVLLKIISILCDRLLNDRDEV